MFLILSTRQLYSCTPALDCMYVQFMCMSVYALPDYLFSLLLIGSVSIERVNFNYSYRDDVSIIFYFNNLMENPFYNDGYNYNYYYYQSFNVPCILNQLVFRNTHTNEVFQAEYTGTCSSYSTNIIQINMNHRDFLRLFENEFIDTTSTTSLEMYTADMLGAPFNLQIQQDEAVEFVLRLFSSPYVRIGAPDYWTDEGILLIHFNNFIDVAIVNASKLSLSRHSYYNRDANNTVNITGGEVLNQSPGLTLSVAIKLTSNDQDLLASKRICTGGDESSIYDCYLITESGFATAYFGAEFYSTANSYRNYYTVNKIRRAPTGEHNVL